MYKNTSRDLVNIAKIKKGMSVVDLACGTGITTQAILKKTGDAGKIYAVDFSREMLAVSKKKNKAGNIDFILSRAEKIDEVIKEKVDRVVCNSAFWQLPATETLRAIKNILKDDGILVFNLAPGFVGKPIERPPLRLLMAEVAVGEYGFPLRVAPFDFNALKRIFDGESFIIAPPKTIEYQLTPEEIYEFNRIPLMTEVFFPGLNYRQRMRILDKAYAEFDKNGTYPNKWSFFTVKKKNKKN